MVGPSRHKRLGLRCLPGESSCTPSASPSNSTSPTHPCSPVAGPPTHTSSLAIAAGGSMSLWVVPAPGRASISTASSPARTTMSCSLCSAAAAQRPRSGPPRCAARYVRLATRLVCTGTVVRERATPPSVVAAPTATSRSQCCAARTTATSTPCPRTRLAPRAPRSKRGCQTHRRYRSRRRPPRRRLSPRRIRLRRSHTPPATV